MNKYTLYNRNNKLYVRINNIKKYSLGTTVPFGCSLIPKERRIVGSHLDVPDVNAKISEWDTLFNQNHLNDINRICDLCSFGNKTKIIQDKTKTTFIDMFTDIYNKMYEGNILHNGKFISRGTLYGYITVLHVLESFDKVLYLEDIDEGQCNSLAERMKCRKTLNEYINEFIKYSIQLKYHLTTRRNQIKNIKSILKKSCDLYGYIIQSPKKPAELKSPVIALTPQQVELIDKNKPNDPSLETIWYITRFLLHSCMRIGDAMEFALPDSKEYIKYINRKTGATSVFYLPEDIRKYLNTNPQINYTEKTLRNKLKKLLKSYSEFNKKIIIYDYDYTNNLITKRLPIYEVITPHKLRASGITWYLYLGYSEREVREISGHANGSNAFYRYTDITDSETRKKTCKPN